jgi:hypothetical protein
VLLHTTVSLSAKETIEMCVLYSQFDQARLCRIVKLLPPKFGGISKFQRSTRMKKLASVHVHNSVEKKKITLMDVLAHNPAGVHYSHLSARKHLLSGWLGASASQAVDRTVKLPKNSSQLR